MTGLSAQEAAQRLAADGPDELKEGKRIGPLQIFLGQFKSLILWTLIAAGVISGRLGELGDTIALVVPNPDISHHESTFTRKIFVCLTGQSDPVAVSPRRSRPDLRQVGQAGRIFHTFVKYSG